MDDATAHTLDDEGLADSVAQYEPLKRDKVKVDLFGISLLSVRESAVLLIFCNQDSLICFVFE